MSTPDGVSSVPAVETEEAQDEDEADSDAENKLNPDEYEDDTTDWDQSEAVANESQNEVTICEHY